ncbi:ATP-binding domain-containing protein [Photobacterium japonica]|uniref:ATP-binding domain-containing protein n=1 Tax=Photobacterium japonica TaxID=2910235 RepID=UPI003D09A2F6
MSSSFFYLQVEKNEENNALLTSLEQFSAENMKQVYVLDRPLGDAKYSYHYEHALVLLAPDHKLTFVNLGSEDDDFEEFVEDFIEDLGSISDKYRYKDKIGRPRKWREELINEIDASDIDDWNEFFRDIYLDDPKKQKKSELLISLLTGSINDIEKVKEDVPDNVLDRVKQKILLFDGDQTRFIYQKPNKNTIRIQGLSGTGKTELLLHKLKELYVSEENSDSRIMFTCHNKILAASLYKRIPDFFDFMKVEQQILWNQRLWCVSAWGSQYDKNSGAYSYICDFYGAQFYRYSKYTSFDDACKNTINHLKNNGSIAECGYAFDYVLLDESQDFPDSFVELCQLVTSKNVYVAGDIFQSIFDENLVSEIEPDFLLSKCYRTDPRTLMFAHALGMGLFETPKLRWLEDKEWLACGYQPLKNGDKYELSREPLRRFADVVDEDHPSVEIVRTSANLNETSETKIIDVIKRIKNENPSVTVDDIGIIFIDSHDYVYSTADNLYFSIKQEFGWDVNKAYESKNKIKGALFVSNKNNVKGLEFPFVICVTKKINNYQSYRNALYMMLTRSFLTSYLLINEESNVGLLASIEGELENINKTGKLVIKKPTKDEIQQIKTTIKYTDLTKSFYDSVYDLFDELSVPLEFRKQFYKIIQQTVGDGFERETVIKVIEFNKNLLS